MPEMTCPHCGCQVTVNIASGREYGHQRETYDRPRCPCRDPAVDYDSPRRPKVSRRE